MVSIYALETDGLVWYVGSTVNVAKRRTQHKTRVFKNIGSDLIPIDYEFEFKILETCESENRYIRERYWYELLKPLVNIEVPGRSVKEYQQNHKEKIKEYKQNYKERYNELQRIRRAKAKAKISNPHIEYDE